MIRALNTVMIWLMLAALPLQGVAAVAKSTCGPRHHAMMVAGTPDHHHNHADVANHDGQANHHSAASLDQAQHGSDGDVTAKASSCSACSACCIGAAAPPSDVSLPPKPMASDAIAVFPAVAFIDHIPAGLERPPRYSLA